MAENFVFEMIKHCLQSRSERLRKFTAEKKVPPRSEDAVESGRFDAGHRFASIPAMLRRRAEPTAAVQLP